jgi:hypothetical protein
MVNESTSARERLLEDLDGVVHGEDEVEEHRRNEDLDERATNMAERKPTPLPKLQLSVLLILQLAEPIAATVILPFIVQVSRGRMLSRDCSEFLATAYRGDGDHWGRYH